MRRSGGIALVVVSLLLLTGCTGGRSTSSAITTTVTAPAPQRAGHEPGAKDVSTTAPGKEFDAQPNFYYFTECGRPCYLPLYPIPELIKGTAVTSGFPEESLTGAGDTVHVVCQIEITDPTKLADKNYVLSNDVGVRSPIWDRVEVPTAKLLHGPGSLIAAPDRKGWHNKKCPS